VADFSIEADDDLQNPIVHQCLGWFESFLCFPKVLNSTDNNIKVLPGYLNKRKIVLH
jgi:hypothetical protein